MENSDHIEALMTELDSALMMTVQDITNVRWMREHVDAWHDQANMVFTPLVMVYRQLTLLDMRRALLITYLGDEAVMWSDTKKATEDQWEPVRERVAQELLDWGTVHPGTAHRIRGSCVSFADQRQQVFRRRSTDALKVLEPRRVAKISRLFASVYTRSADALKLSMPAPGLRG